MHTRAAQDRTRASIGIQLVDIGSTTTMSIEPQVIAVIEPWMALGILLQM